MDLPCEDTIGSLVDQWWNDSLFDAAFPASVTTPGTDNACPVLSPTFSPFDIRSMYDDEYEFQSGLKQEFVDQLPSEPAVSPPALSPSVASTMSTVLITEAEMSQEAGGLSTGQEQCSTPESPRRKRSLSRSSDTSRKLRHSVETSITSSRGTSLDSDGMPAAYVRRTSTKTVSGTRQPLASRRLAPATISSPKPEFNERKSGPVGHNAVEKRYRDKINAQFHRLLSALPNVRPEDDDGRSLSKATVLELALQTVQNLERENRALCQQVEQLEDTIRFGGMWRGDRSS